MLVPWQHSGNTRLVISKTEGSNPDPGTRRGEVAESNEDKKMFD